MNQPSMPGSEASLRSRAIPWPVWLLLAGAIVQLAVQVAPDSYQVFGPYFLVNGSMLVGWLQSITPFVLAAAVVLGADRWPAGRRKLLVAAAALAVVGVLRLALDAWWTLWETAPGPIPPETTPWLTFGWIGAGLAATVAYGLMAAGIWTARPDRPAGIARVALSVAIGLAGLVATGAGVWVVAQTLELRGTADGRWAGSLTSIAWAAGFATLAALAVAAVRTVRPDDPLPEALIGGGAAVTMAASAWTWSYPQIAPTQAWEEEAIVWAFTIPSVVVLIGTLAMIAGFVLAALVAHRRTGDPSA
jgi:hypothetical protein